MAHGEGSSALPVDWQLLDSSGPGLAFHAGAIVGDRLLLHGGIDRYQSTKPLCGLFEFSLTASGSWKRLPDGPALSHHAAVAVQDRYLVLVGGWTGRERTCQVHIFDCARAAWSQAAVSGFPEGAGLSSHTTTPQGAGKWLVIGREGGLRTQRRHGNAYMLSGSAEKGRFVYESAALGTASRSGHTAAWLDAATLCVVGGRDDRLIELHRAKGGRPECAACVTILQTLAGSGKLQKLNKMPGGRKNHVVASNGAGALLLHGGETFDGRSKGPVGDMLLMTLPGPSVFRVGDSALKRAGAVCAVNSNSAKVYLHGGFGPSYTLANQLFEM